jgi:hypothetical protein
MRRKIERIFFCINKRQPLARPNSSLAGCMQKKIMQTSTLNALAGSPDKDKIFFLPFAFRFACHYTAGKPTRKRKFIKIIFLLSARPQTAPPRSLVGRFKDRPTAVARKPSACGRGGASGYHPSEKN